MFANMAIKSNPLKGIAREPTRKLPLKMTPSGGARNPYEAYVYALNVEGLPFGVYHYSAIDNTLGLLSSSPHCSATELLGSIGPTRQTRSFCWWLTSSAPCGSIPIRPPTAFC
jgi:hypothetical protein